MVEVDIPQSLFEEQGRQLYGAQLLQIPVSTPRVSLHTIRNMCLWFSVDATSANSRTFVTTGKYEIE